MTTDSSTGDWTPERIEEARGRCERATPGPWEIEREECYEPDFDDEEPLGYPRRIGPIESWDHAQGGRGTDESAAIVEADAAFIAHARADLPAALAEIERLTAELAARAPADASLDARAKIDAPADLARALAEAHRIVRHESAIRDGETLVWVLPILLRAVDASRPGLTEEQAQIARAEPAIAAWLDYFAAMDRQHKSGTAADARIVRDLRAKANGMDRFVADVVYHVALARHRASRGETGPAPSKPAKESDDAPDSGHDDTALTAEQYDRHKARIASGEIPGGAPTTHTVDFGCARPTHAGPEATCSLCHPAPEAP